MIYYKKLRAEVVKLVDTTDLKSVELLNARAGSIPAPGTKFFNYFVFLSLISTDLLCASNFSIEVNVLMYGANLFKVFLSQFRMEENFIKSITDNADENLAAFPVGNT